MKKTSQTFARYTYELSNQEVRDAVVQYLSDVHNTVLPDEGVTFLATPEGGLTLSVDYQCLSLDGTTLTGGASLNVRP